MRGGLVDALDIWIGGVKQRRGGWLLLLLLHGVGSVGVLASLDGLDDAQCVVLGVLGLGRDLRVVFLPDAQDIEEGRCSHEGVGRGGCDPARVRGTPCSRRRRRRTLPVDEG